MDDYMAAHQHSKTATALWSHFQTVINRVEAVFANYRKEMKGVDWGGLYGKLKDESLDPERLEAEVARLMIDDDVTKKAGIYPYLLTREEKYLNIRAFSDSVKRKAFEIQGGICESCDKKFEMSEMDADHITPWSEGGKTNEGNCQMLCRACNRRKKQQMSMCGPCQTGQVTAKAEPVSGVPDDARAPVAKAVSRSVCASPWTT